MFIKRALVHEQLNFLYISYRNSPPRPQALAYCGLAQVPLSSNTRFLRSFPPPLLFPPSPPPPPFSCYCSASFPLLLLVLPFPRALALPLCMPPPHSLALPLTPSALPPSLSHCRCKSMSSVTVLVSGKPRRAASR